MHEMSIAESIIEIVEKEAGKARVKSVEEVELEIGFLAGIEYESLSFALKVLAPGSILQGTNIVIHKPPGLARCKDCDHEFSTDNAINICPECQSYGCNIIRGKELRVSSILID
jgi:hydrogenase nickel incorporation protein HypA/HybF